MREVWVVIRYNENEKKLESISIEGDCIIEINPIQYKPINEWFEESSGRDGWEGLIPELYKRISDNKVCFQFHFDGYTSSKEIFENCLREKNVDYIISSVSKEQVIDKKMKEAQKAEYLGEEEKAAKLYEEVAMNDINPEADFKLAEIAYEKYQKDNDMTALDRAVIYYERAAKYGNERAQNKLGLLYFKGEGVEKNCEKGIELYKKAVKNGNSEAMYGLATAYFHGQGVARDINEALELCNQASELGYSEAQYTLASILLEGEFVSKDERRAFVLYKKAAEQGLDKARFMLGQCYFYGDGIEEDYYKAIQCYEKLAEEGDSDAQYMLGQCYKYIGIENDEAIETEDKFIDWTKKAAEQGHLEACVAMGDYYLYIREEDEIQKKNFEKEALVWYKKAAEEGYARAEHAIGRYYLIESLGTLDSGEFNSNEDEDPLKQLRKIVLNMSGARDDSIEYQKKSFEWYLKAAEKGYVEAQRDVGECYFSGYGEISVDYYKAFEWYKKAAEQGDYFSKMKIADCYLNGTGTEINYDKALQIYKEENDKIGIANCYFFMGDKNKDYEREAIELYKEIAEECDDSEVLYKLGICYYTGIAVEQNYKEALKWFRKAKNSDSLLDEYKNKVSYYIGECYYYGDGVEQDYGNAVIYYEEAVKGLYENADAQYKLGMCYYYGDGVEQNYAEALKWFTKARDSDSLSDECENYASYYIGECYYFGHGAEQDYGKAVEFYKESAIGSYGNSNAQYSLGWCYEKGQGVSKNLQEAFRWYKKAADNAHSGACYRVAKAYEDEFNKLSVGKVAKKGGLIAAAAIIPVANLITFPAAAIFNHVSENANKKKFLETEAGKDMFNYYKIAANKGHEKAKKKVEYWEKIKK